MAPRVRNRNLLVAGALCMAAAGCTSMGSQMDRSAEGRSNTGVQYYLPKKLVTLELYKSQLDGFVFPRFSETVVGDTDFSYVAKLNRAIASDNKLSVTVDASSRLLDDQSSADSTARGADIAREFARSYTALESGGGRRTEIFIGKVVFDPLDPDAVSRANVALTTAFQAFVRQDCDIQVDQDTGELLIPGGIFADDRLVEQCLFLQDLALDPAPIRISVSDNPGHVPLPGDPMVPAKASLDPDDFRRVCNTGLCYRATAPHRLSVSVADRMIVDEILDLPNNQPPLVIRQPAGVFADQNTSITWVQGMPQTVGVDRNSEVAGFASVPAQVVEAVSEAVVAGFNRDRAEIDAEIALLNAQANLLNAQASSLENELTLDQRLDALNEERRRLEEERAARDAARAAAAGGGTSFSGAVPIPEPDVSVGGLPEVDPPPATSVIPR